MAGLFYWCRSGKTGLTGATPKSFNQLIAPAHQRIKFHKVRVIGGQAAGGLDAVVDCRFTRSTVSFGTFAGGNIYKVNPSDPETIQATYAGVASAEPSSPIDGGWGLSISPELAWAEDFDPPLEIPGGQSGQFELTSAETPTVEVLTLVEE